MDFLDQLNPEQREAVLQVDGPLLILAGASYMGTSMAYTGIPAALAGWVGRTRTTGPTRTVDAANARVELGYLADNHNQVRITGIAEVVTDRAMLQSIWDSNALLRQYLGTLENPELIVYRIRPSRVRFMREWALDYHEVPLP